MNDVQLRRFEQDIHAAVFRVMRDWIDRPSSVQRRDLVSALIKLALAQLQYLNRDAVVPRE